jgi:hypothetical protein
VVVPSLTGGAVAVASLVIGGYNLNSLMRVLN